MSTTIEELLDRLYFSASNETEKGSSFERLMASYLRTAPEYADRFDEVYLWQDWPERGNRRDTGIDIVARDAHTGGWCAVQCKFYEPSHHMSKKDIDSFIAASNTSDFTSRIVISTARDWGATVESQMATLAPPVVRIGIHDLLDSKVDWARIDWTSPRVENFLPTEGKKTLRPHQRHAKDAVLEGFAAGDRGQLVMACGTGKTFTSLKIAEELATSRKAQATTVLFLVPSIQLLNQTLREWKQESEIPFRAFAVCSDAKVGKRVDTEDLGIQDLIYPATTDTVALARQVKERAEDDQFTVIFSTYQSIDVVAQAQRDGLVDFDLIICDEAHRTTGATLVGQDESAFVRVHDNTYLKGAKRLYMTATPRLFNPETKDKAAAADAVLASMDDGSVFGPVWHRLGFGEAVEKDLLTDYKVLVLTVDEEYVAAGFQQELAQSGEIKLEDAAKLVGCWNGLAKRFDQQQTEDTATDVAPMRTAVAFAANIKASKAATEAFPSVVDRLISTYATDADGPDSGNRMSVAVEHVDGTMNALERGRLLEWLKSGANDDDNSCRILSNVRCLSEGVDVPALDAVMFLSPRKSQVDVVQSVGRVMRKAPGKELGYIILPVVIPAGVPPEEALRDNKRFQTVWEVLQALRAHDDRFNAMVNQLDLNKRKDTRIQIFDATPGGEGEQDSNSGSQLSLPFGIDRWRDAIYARIVAKVGERRYWETWAKDVADIASHHITRINALLADPTSDAAKEFDTFLVGLRGILNEGITRTDAVEMLAQHLITRPVFEALFAGYDFAGSNPVAKTMETMLATLAKHSLDTENSALEGFYASVRSRVEGIDNAEGRQRIIVELYDKFFATAFKRTVDKLGIVYTPIEIVDFILRSADEVMREHFGQGLTDEGVHILDGFTGTGTFIVRLLQLGLIEPHDLARKYTSELHANEILLLAYYIAAVNIESTYADLTGEEQDFPGLVLTDTFQSYEDGDQDAFDAFPETSKRIARQRELPITVIVGNPPYSVGQGSANEDNPNEKYPALDRAIEVTYAERSVAASKRTLYDGYIRAIKWASLRIRNRGVIAYVTNGGWLDSNSADGMRLTLAEEFSAIYVYNLRGNARTAGEQRQKEGGTVFDAGSRATVAITILVKDSASTGPAVIYYADIGDYLGREQKLCAVAEAVSVSGLEPVRITPNSHGDWLSLRDSQFSAFPPLGSRTGEQLTVFNSFGLGLGTNRDAWIYNASAARIHTQMAISTRSYESALAGQRTNDPALIKWSSSLEARLKRGQALNFDPLIRTATYRPFERSHAYGDLRWVHRPGAATHAFPAASTVNHGIYTLNPGAEKPFSALMTDSLPDLALYGSNAGQFFARWRYEKVEDDGRLTFESDADVIDGYRKIDNITDAAHTRFAAAYGDSITKDDIFFYCYGLLHSPDYREIYAADLKKTLPRIPLTVDPWPYIEAGRALADLHLGYETVEPFPLVGLDVQPPEGSDAYDFFRVERMAFAKFRDPETKRLVADKPTVVYNDRITLSGIPQEAYRYMLGSRSAIEWIIDRYQIKTDKASGIVNDPNDWSREVGDPRYIIDLLARIVTVSLETMKIVDALPALEILTDHHPTEA